MVCRIHVGRIAWRVWGSVDSTQCAIPSLPGPVQAFDQGGHDARDARASPCTNRK